MTLIDDRLSQQHITTHQSLAGFPTPVLWQGKNFNAIKHCVGILLGDRGGNDILGFAFWNSVGPDGICIRKL